MRLQASNGEVQQSKPMLREHPNPRQSSVHQTILGAAATIYLCLYGVMELSKEDTSKTFEQTPLTSVADVERMVRSRFDVFLEYQDVESAINERYAYECAQGCTNDSGHRQNSQALYPSSSTRNNADPPSKTMWQRAYATGEEHVRNAHWFMDYMLHYRLSKTQAKGRISLDCNDYSAIACEELSAAGLKPYIHCIWPQNGNKYRRWHQFTSCKLDTSLYLINDNDRAILWNGSLEEYATYGASKDLAMEFMPVIGTSKYEIPAYDMGAAKFLLQVKHATSHEELMQFGGQTTLIADR